MQIEGRGWSPPPRGLLCDKALRPINVCVTLWVREPERDTMSYATAQLAATVIFAAAIIYIAVQLIGVALLVVGV